MRKSTMELGRDTPVSYLYGIGPKKSEAFARLGIFTLRDLCYHFPRAYENRGNVKTLAEAADGEVCALLMTVAGTPRSAKIRRGMIITKLRVFDESGNCNITYFNAPYVRDALRTGETYRFFGRVYKKGGSTEMTSPSYEPYREGVKLRPFLPVYPLTEGISQKQMSAAVAEALKILLSPTCRDGIRDVLPYETKRAHSLPDIEYALRQIHFPDGYNEVEKARRRLAFDEIFLFVLSSLVASGSKDGTPGEVFDISHGKHFLDQLPYTPTDAQMRTIKEINADLTSGRRMSRIITGDVGSGKTMCAAYALFTALANGFQAAMMAPTEILARQHYLTLSPVFEKLGYDCELLIGALTPTKKRRICDKIAEGTPLLVVGTHALIEDGVVFPKLGLIVIDEQHRFGAAQRENLKNKSRNAHLISMSATPIPRTLALVLYGDLDISSIDQMPPGRQIVETFVVDESYRPRIDKFIEKNVSEGGQVYIVCPSIEEQETIESESGEKIPLSALETFVLSDEKPKLKAAVNFAEELQKKFPNFRIGFIHGKLRSASKEKIMAEFVSGKLDILVSTTVIEVGVNVPSASLMIIENAEFFGLSTLHQLRGRVGRGDRKSYCILVSDTKSEKSRERLSILQKEHSGYAIAERDLEIRGPGDFLARNGGKIRQSGDVDLKLAEMLSDKDLLYAAADAARKVCDADKYLTSPENAPIAAELSYIRQKTARME
ncbi:MAG: ATP-dependent DNA helicase RecG [Clostridia bacterium]|nr:ATP-dependent DNA helicase RecG [Clostridia bacterium]